MKKKVLQKNSLVWKVSISLLILLLLASFLTFLYYINFILLDYKEIPTGTTITQSGSGLFADRETLLFGKNHPGGWSQRSFYIATKQTALVRIKAVGNISPMLNFSENDFILEPNITKRIYVNLNVPTNVKLGNYTGNVKVYLLKN